VRNRHVFVLSAVAAVAIVAAACSDSNTPPPARPGEPPSLELKPTETRAPENAGFDECGLVETDELAAALGVDAMYVTSRAAMDATDGDRRTSCTYFTEDVPGVLGMSLSTVTGTDPERFFAPFHENYSDVETIEDLGDRAEAVAYAADGTSIHFVEIRTIAGDQGLHLYYTYRDGGDMPPADGAAAAKILVSALDRLPAEVTIPDGTPEGPCADIDLEPAADALGADMAMARTVESGDAVSCFFSGGGASFDVSVVTDPDRVAQSAVTADKITHPGIGDGARLAVTDANTLNARVNAGDRFVMITANYGTETVTALRDADVDLVRAVVAAVGVNP
jgi:hypothetical protein